MYLYDWFQMEFMETDEPDVSADGETDQTLLDPTVQQTDYTNGYEGIR